MALEFQVQPFFKLLFFYAGHTFTALKDTKHIHTTILLDFIQEENYGHGRVFPINEVQGRIF